MKTSIEKDFDALAEVMYSTTGVAKDELLGRSTRYPLAYYRGMIAEQLRQRGHTLPAIGMLLGRRHSTILHELYIIRSLYLPCYSVVQEEYEAFKRKCEERGLDDMVRETIDLINKQNEEIKTK